MPASARSIAVFRAGPLALLVALLWMATAAPAQTLPALTGRVVDQAEVIPPDREAALAARLEALERATSRQLVVVTVPDLQGETIEDFGFRLGDSWKIGDEEADNGAILLVAMAERKIRIEVGDGLEPILTDAMSGLIIRETMRPRFQDGDPAGGIEAGVDAIIEQLQAPPEVAEQRALEAARSEAGGGEDGSIFPLIFWIVVLLFILVPLLRSGFRGRRYRGRRRGIGPVVIWGPTLGSGWGSGRSSGSGWSGWSGGGGGGGFSGGGGSFGGGGASGGW